MRSLLCLICMLSMTVGMTSRAKAEESRYRISLLTGGPGEELWETFGHACIRVVDSAVSGQRHDLVYNYGFFDAANGSIGKQFLTGRVKVFLDTITFDELIVEYTDKKRSLAEQELLLTPLQKAAFVAYLENNLLPQNRYYEYDAFFDNCTTRIRDALYAVLGRRLVLGKAIPGPGSATVRDVSIDPFCNSQKKRWFGLGLHLCYGAKIDRKMSNSDALFLPNLLSRSVAGATIDGRPLAKHAFLLKEEHIVWADSSVHPVFVAWFVALLSGIGLFFHRLSKFSRVFSLLVCTITGLVGGCLLYLWAIDAEPGWDNNLNILWAFPLHAFILFFPRPYFVWYSRVAMGALILLLVIQISGYQMFPLAVISPVLLSFLFLFVPYLRTAES